MRFLLAGVALWIALVSGVAQAAEQPPVPASDDPSAVEGLPTLRRVRTAGLLITYGAAVPVMFGGYASLIVMSARPLAVSGRISQAMLVVGTPLMFLSARAATRHPAYQGGKGGRTFARVSMWTYGGMLYGMLVAEASIRGYRESRDAGTLALGILHVAAAILFGGTSVTAGSIACLRSTSRASFGLSRASLVPVLGSDRAGLVASVRF